MQPRTWDPRRHPAYLVGRVTKLFKRHVASSLAAVGVTDAHVPVLRALSDGEPRTQTELAELAHIEQPTMAQMLARMEDAGLVVRAPHPTDGRSTLFSLTAPARAKVPRVQSLMESAGRDLFRGFSPKELDQLRSLLERAIENLEPPAEDPRGTG